MRESSRHAPRAVRHVTRSVPAAFGHGTRSVPAASTGVPSMLDPVLDIFREEAREHLGALEGGFLDLEAASDPEARRSTIDTLFRHAHSLKGDARAIGLPELQVA